MAHIRLIFSIFFAFEHPTSSLFSGISTKVPGLYLMHSALSLWMALAGGESEWILGPGILQSNSHGGRCLVSIS
jgi:hypothetical protein